jgi:sRNA-binding carbon storage regulator CsrA
VLQLWRNVGERIMIGDDVVLTLVSNTNGVEARVQIQAPQIADGPRIARVALREPYRLTAEISFTLDPIERTGARFHIKAPREVQIYREEIYNEKLQERGIDPHNR